MKNNIELENIYFENKKAFDTLKSRNKHSYKTISLIIENLSYNSSFHIFKENNFHLEELSKLLRFYEDLLNNSFLDDKEQFKILFNSYILIIESFSQLCALFAKEKEKVPFIEKIMQSLKESKNMVKLFIPLDEKSLRILNNFIGKHLYYYSHLEYISAKDKKLDYLFQEYAMHVERMIHGFELASQMNFADCDKTLEKNEKMVLLNNISFLLLKLIHKLRFYNLDIDYFENNYFQKLLCLYKKISLLKDISINDKQGFEKTLIKEFSSTANTLLNETNINMFEEKLRLLMFNTDEYKQLIDIILSSKQ